MSDESNTAAAATACLSEEDVLAFAAGRLSITLRRDAHQHFDRCELCQELLNEAVHALATAPTAGLVENDEVAWSTTFRPGTLVGQRYVIRRFIARGGMGEVYEAFDQELQERVALKTVTSTACDNPTAVRRLKAEVQLARRVSHPNVCRIYDFGVHAPSNGNPQVSFLTMEFVEGETLGKRLRREGALPSHEAQVIAEALLHGLKAAHDAGVLHRDFKSDNVILRPEGDKLQPVILDFGLARALDHEAQQSSSSNQGLVGTFAYIAPEQLEGKPFSTASDVYSLGLVWFEMLTGELPFKPTSSPALPALERLTRPVPPPSSKNPGVPRQVDAVVLACLRRHPAERLQKAGDVLARLDAAGRAQTGEPRDPGARGRGRALAPLAPLAPLVLAVGIIVSAYFAVGARERTPTASAGAPRTQESQPRSAAVPAFNPASDASAAAPPPASLPTKPSPAGATPAKASKSKTPPVQRPADEQPDAGAPQPTKDSRGGWENPFPENG